MMLLLVLATTAWVLKSSVNGLLGYDCKGEGLNVTVFSLTNIEECQLEDLEPITEETYVQLLQLSEFDHTIGMQCRIEIDRTISYCRMHSHTSSVLNGKLHYIYEISAETCQKLQNTGTLFLGGRDGLITGVKVNATTTRAVTLAGSISVDGRCSGTQYSDPYGTWENVIVQASVRITLRRMQLPIKHMTNEVILPYGTRCRATEGECYDADGTMTYWRTAPTDCCQFNKYDVPYEGMAHRLFPKPTQKESPIIYTVTTEDTTFALAKTTDTNLCGYKIIQTEPEALRSQNATRSHVSKHDPAHPSTTSISSLM